MSAAIATVTASAAGSSGYTCVPYTASGAAIEKASDGQHGGAERNREAPHRDPDHQPGEHAGEQREGELGADPAADAHRHREERRQQRVVRADLAPVVARGLLHRQRRASWKSR